MGERRDRAGDPAHPQLHRTAWFHTAARASHAFCFPRGRIHFLSPAGDQCSPTQGQALFYFGADDEAFRRTFADVGLVVPIRGIDEDLF